jgi:hypothetical protein
MASRWVTIIATGERGYVVGITGRNLVIDLGAHGARCLAPGKVHFDTGPPRPATGKDA